MAFDHVALLMLPVLLIAAVFGSAVLSQGRKRAASMRKRQGLQDVLTGVGNRPALFRSGTALLVEGQRACHPAALLLMDLDGFMALQRRHGQDAGDRLLVAFARMVHEYLPPTSLVCRLAGHAFAAVLPGADPARARSVADEIRALFAHFAVAGPCGPVRTTVSIGVALQTITSGVAVPQSDMADLLERAGRCLHAAKNAGRNRVVTEDDVARNAPAPRAAPDLGAVRPALDRVTVL